MSSMSKSIIAKCKIKDCDGLGLPDKRRGKRYFVKGYCGAHYSKSQKYGNPLEQRHARDGRLKHPMYKRWVGMIDRCHNPNRNNYKDYGKKGIEVCPEWKEPINGFVNFVEYVSRLDGYGAKGMTLDRIDNNEGYKPNNVRWATKHQQESNTSKSNDVVGVSYISTTGYWSAYLHVNGKQVLGNLFKNREDAIRARREAEIKYEVY